MLMGAINLRYERGSHKHAVTAVMVVGRMFRSIETFNSYKSISRQGS
jgi:hypothetical protein